MISGTLMKQTVKSSIFLWCIITAILAVSLAGMAGNGAPIAMTGTVFYGMVPGLITAIFIIIVSNKLIAAQVDRGTMAYILSTPTKRSKVAITQATFFIGSLLLMCIITAATHILVTYNAAGSISWDDVAIVLLLNLGMFLLNLALSGIAYLASSVFNLSKHSIAIGGGIVGAFHLASIMSMFGASFQFLKNLTLVSLFDTSSVIAGTPDFIIKFVILAAVGCITYAIGVLAFSKRDLPL